MGMARDGDGHGGARVQGGGGGQKLAEWQEFDYRSVQLSI